MTLVFVVVGVWIVVVAHLYLRCKPESDRFLDLLIERGEISIPDGADGMTGMGPGTGFSLIFRLTRAHSDPEVDRARRAALDAVKPALIAFPVGWLAAMLPYLISGLIGLGG